MRIAPNKNVGEQGSIILLMAISVLVLLIMIGLAIDVGNLYRANIALQNAADAAAVSTVNKITMQGKVKFLDDIAALDSKYTVKDDRSNESEAVTAYLKDTRIAENLLRVNLALNGFPHESGVTDTEVTPKYFLGTDPDNPGNKEDGTAAYSIKVRASRPIKHFLMPALVNSGKKLSLSANSKAQRRFLNITMVMDISGSMACPAASADPTASSCSCLVPPYSSACPASGRRFDALADAMNVFLKMLDMNRDEINFVPFNIAAYPNSAVALKNLAGIGNNTRVTGSDIDNLITFFKTAYIPYGETNVCDALFEAYNLNWPVHAAKVKGREKETLNYLFFTDGAPTAGRFFFAPGSVSALPKNKLVYSHPDPDNAGSTITYSPSDYDYMSYIVEWLNTSNQFAPGPSAIVPSRLLCGGNPDCPYGGGYTNPNVSGMDKVQREPPAGDPIPPATTTSAYCSADGLGGTAIAPPVHATFKAPTNPLTYPPEIVSTDVGDVPNGAATKVFSPCVSSMQAQWPAASGTPKTYGATYKDSSAIGFDKWREQYFNCAIELADFIRSQRGMFYVVGLGYPPHKVQPTIIKDEDTYKLDPYQNIDDTYYRKDIFLSRLALDLNQKAAIDSVYSSEFSVSKAPEFRYDAYTSYSDSASSKTKGIYLPASSPEDIKLMFIEIARRLLLKLVS